MRVKVAQPWTLRVNQAPLPAFVSRAPVAEHAAPGVASRRSHCHHCAVCVLHREWRCDAHAATTVRAACCGLRPVAFVARVLQAFDPKYASEPLAVFEPMVARVLGRDQYSLTPDNPKNVVAWKAADLGAEATDDQGGRAGVAAVGPRGQEPTACGATPGV